MCREIKLLFATNRNCDCNSGVPSCGTKISKAIHYGYIDSNGGRHSLDREPFLNRLQETLNAGGDILNFIHGYNANFDDAIDTAEQVYNHYGENTVTHKRDLVLLSWPSLGKLLAVKQDFDNATLSGSPFAHILKSQLKLDSSENAIHLHCQSFGNVAMNATVQELKVDRVKLAQVIMTSPTLPEASFSNSKQLLALPDMADRVTVYYNTHDFGQCFQWLLDTDTTMLQRGPKRDAMLSNIVVVNVHPVAGARHKYYLQSAKVIADVRATLNGTPADSSSLKRRKTPKNYELF